MKFTKMVTGIITAFFMVGIIMATSAFSSEFMNANEMRGFNDAGLKKSETTTAGLVIGATTIDGVNYQQIGIRADIPIGKLGIGLDINLLLDEEGNVREEDWDETEDYFDLIYYIRWDRKGAPFYAKVGGLDYSWIGYSNIVNGYSNMIEYPDYKRIGMELELNQPNFRAELMMNDFKELSTDEPSMVIASRLAYKIGGKLEIGVTAATDLNEYNGFRDDDDDGYPNEIDQYPDNDQYVTNLDYLNNQGFSQSTIDEIVAHGGFEGYPVTSETKETLSEFDFDGKKSDLTIYGIDIGYPILEGGFVKMDIYSAYADIQDYGWGITAPGFRTLLGNVFSFRAEYRIQSKEFLYGYFNQTYELERAQFFNPEDGSDPSYTTKQDQLKAITDDMSGYLVGAGFNLLDYVALDATYQQMDADDEDDEYKSIYGELILNNNKFSFLPTVTGYYAQNNVEDFDEWKTPSTVTGAVISYNVGNATLSFNHQYTFVDVNGDGEIEGDEETVKTLSVSTTVTF